MKIYLLIGFLVCGFIPRATLAQTQVSDLAAHKKVQAPAMIKPPQMVSQNIQPVYVAGEKPLAPLLHSLQQKMNKTMAQCPGRKAPVPTLTLSGERKNNAAASLTWETKNAYRAAGFTVQRSLADSEHFADATLAPVAAGNAAKKNYRLADRNDFAGVSYYRIKMMNKDTTVLYSNIARVNGYARVTLNVFPNPAKERLVVAFSAAQPGQATVMVYAVSGKMVQQQKVACSKDAISQTILLVDQLAPGTYQVKVFMPGETVVSGQFIKG